MLLVAFIHPSQLTELVKASPTKSNRSRQRLSERKIADELAGHPIKEVNRALHRFALLADAERLGNIARACRERNVSRQHYYEWKKRFDRFDAQGLLDKPRSRPHKVSSKKKHALDVLFETALANPHWGCVRLARSLSAKTIRLSPPTIQKWLADRDLRAVQNRVALLEKRVLDSKIAPNPSQIQILQRANPRFKEWRLASQRPGQLLVQDNIRLTKLPGIRKAYLQIAVDTFSSHAFCWLAENNTPYDASAVLYHLAIPTFEKWGLRVEEVLTTNRPAFWGTWKNPYRYCLHLDRIRHRVERQNGGERNGFIEDFKRLFVVSFLRPLRQASSPQDLESLKTPLSDWLVTYNNSPRAGFPTRGRSPVQLIHEFLTVMSKT